MKCPKCGYNSFEFLDSCKKCNSNLTGFRTAHGIRAIVFPSKQFVAATPAEEAVDDRIPDLVEPPMAESSEFSWQDSPEPAAEPEGFPSLEFDLPQQEPDTFSFNLDLPSQEEGAMAQEDAFKELSLENLGGDELPSPAAPSVATESASWDEPATQQEPQAFGEFSFDEPATDADGTETTEPETTTEPLPDFFASAVPGAGEESVSDDTFDRTGSGIDQVDVAAFDFGQDLTADLPVDPLPADDEPPAPQSGDSEADLLGLSPEEYESLFGESPLKKKDVARQ